MSSVKRTAGRELNHDNWNDEEEAEEAGEFKRASESELQKRVIKTAKRKIVGDSTDGAKSNPFSGFGGFKTTNSFSTSTPSVNATNSSPFAFLNKFPSTNPATTLQASSTLTSTTKLNGNSTEKKNESKSTYHSSLKELNHAFLAWIKKHVEEDSLVNLTPCFKSYEDHLKTIKESKKPETNNNEKKTTNAPEPKSTSISFGIPAKPSETTNNAFGSFKFGGSPATKSDEKENEISKTSTGISSTSKSDTITSPTSTFSFGLPKPASPLKPAASATSSGFSFGLSSSTDTNKTLTSTASSTFSFGFNKPDATTTPAAPTFSFGLAATSTPAVFGGFGSTASSFSFGNVTQPPKAAEEAEESEEPPKNEFTQVVEDDSLYSKRCKVFVKSGAEFADRGVGMLYIKKVEDKVQMIVRADTNLGNILLNIILANGLPASRQGKNNVMLMCIPTPEAKPPPTSVLLRVKSGEEADDLLEKINTYKMSE
jgi:nuclear pore complex protein Nup50